MRECRIYPPYIQRIYVCTARMKSTYINICQKWVYKKKSISNHTLSLCECEWRWCVTGGGCEGGGGTWFWPVTTTGSPSTMVTMTRLSALRRRSAEFLLRRCSSVTGRVNTVRRSKRGSMTVSAARVAGVWLFDRFSSLITWDFKASGLLTGGGSSCLCLYDWECAWWRWTDTACPMPAGITFDKLLTAYAASTLFPATHETSYIPKSFSTTHSPASIRYNRCNSNHSHVACAKSKTLQSK